MILGDAPDGESRLDKMMTEEGGKRGERKTVFLIERLLYFSVLHQRLNDLVVSVLDYTLACIFIVKTHACNIQVYRKVNRGAAVQKLPGLFGIAITVPVQQVFHSIQLTARDRKTCLWIKSLIIYG